LTGQSTQWAVVPVEEEEEEEAEEEAEEKEEEGNMTQQMANIKLVNISNSVEFKVSLSCPKNHCKSLSSAR
jgi:hypothetical protein